MMKLVIIGIIFLLCLIAFAKPSDIPFIGYPTITNFSAREYGQHEQNWAACQDTNGIMFFGNTHGLLEYDGTEWILHNTTSPDIVRSLAISKSNTIYIGGYNYFGFLSKDSIGNTVFSSLSDQLNTKEPTFGNVWNIDVIKDCIFFQTDSALFRWDGKYFKHWPTTYPLNRSFVIRDTLYTSKKGLGLVYLVGDQFTPLPGGELFGDEKFYSMAPFRDGAVLIATRNKGLFLVKDGSIDKYITSHDQELIEKQVTSLAILLNGDIAVATRYGGVLVFSRDGRLKHLINRESGLNDNTVWNLYPDNQGNLWVMLNNGLSRITLPTAITRFNQSNGLEGTVESITRFRGKLYFATPQGLFYSDQKTNSRSLQRVAGFKPWKIISTSSALLAQHYDQGIYILDGNRMRRIFDYSGYCVQRSTLDTNRIYIGLSDGLASIYYKNGEWINEGRLEMQISPIRDIIETDSGNLWLGASGSKVYRIILSGESNLFSGAEIKEYSQNQGVLPSKQTYVFSIGHDVLIGNNERILIFDTKQDRFKPAESMNRLIGEQGRSIHELVQDQSGLLWIYGHTGSGPFLGVAEPKVDRSWSWKINPLNPLAGEVFTMIYPDPVEEYIVWLGGPDGVIRYDRRVTEKTEISFPCLIRRVRIKNDSLFWSHKTSSMGQKANIIGNNSIEYAMNQLRFEFTAPFYQSKSDIRFRYRLDGFDNDWSHWTSERKVNYTNIPEGDYIFRVKARNIYGAESSEGTFKFSVLPPWYRTWPMYLFYFLLFITVIYLAVRFRLRAIEFEKKRLERIVRERTDEIHLKNRQLEEQAEQLKTLDKTKSRFFADVSHEFRTPLTLIKGPAEGMLKKTYRGSSDKAFKLILSNADRLLHLINQLLDISKLESGSMKLKASLQPLSPFIAVVINFFSSLAESKHIKLEFINPATELEIYFDKDMLEKILCNLLSNAFKFTPDYGFITVTISRESSNTDIFPEGAAVISVHDSGMGIPEEELVTIFKRFEQGIHAHNHSLTGSGIGLALTRELVLLHHGDIRVSTAVNEGTKFDVYLPLGRSHLQEEEILNGNQITASPTPHDVYIPVNNDKPEPSGGKEPDGSSETPCEIVIVEDNEEVRQYIREHLENDFHIAEAENGSVGEKYIIERLPDLVISDVMMPEMDGIEMTEQLKKNPLTSHIPVILLTAKASEEARIEGLETGADAYMAKPFNAQELLVRAKKLIEGRMKLREAFKKELLLEPALSDATSIQDMFLKKVTGTIQKHLSDPDFGAERLSGSFNLSRRQFHRKVLALTGHTPGQLIRIFRLKKAKQMIESGTASISEIAYEVGFNNLSYFSKCFFEQFGKLPSEINPSQA